MNHWENISGAVCLNVFMSLVEKEPDKIDDLILPLCCGLYISENWNKLNFSKTDNISDLRPYVSEEVVFMKNILLNEPVPIKNKVNNYLDHLNGSLAFSVVIIQALYNENQKIYDNNLKSLFQDCWEIIFWFIQDLEDVSLKSLICDFQDHHITVFNEVLNNINEINPL
jgi:hypothetical protein